MFRLVLVVALAAGVARAGAEPSSKSTSTAHQRTTKSSKKPKKSSPSTRSKKTATKSSSKTSKKTSAKRSRKSRKSKSSKKARVSRRPTAKTLSRNEGMPPGFSWPPTRAMEAAERDCEAKLDRAGVVWERAKPEGRIANPIVVPSMTFGGIRYVNMWGSKGPHELDCQLALALETVGPELHAVGVREVRFGSLFRWSHVRSHGVTRPILSRHGLGIAMDIGSFIDETGREASVKQHYKSGDSLLLAIEQLVNANGNFRILLTPKNDPISHTDHFHLEARADYTSADVP